MPISYRIDKDLKAIFTTGSGVVTGEDLLDHARRLTADPNFSEGAISLVDFCGVTETVDVSSNVVRQVAAIFRASPHGYKAAFVSDNDFIFGMSRMFEMLRDDSPKEIRVFRNLDAAKRWLGLP